MDTLPWVTIPAPLPSLTTEESPSLVTTPPSPETTVDVDPEASTPGSSQRAGETVIPGTEVSELVTSGVKAPVEALSSDRFGRANSGTGGISPTA